jgi:hypothetical protein
MVIATCYDSHESSSGNLEPLNIFEFLLTVLFVSKAADPCVNSGTVSKKAKIFSGSKLTC